MHILAIHSNRPQETVSQPTQSTGTLMLNSPDTNQRHVLAFKKDSKRHDIATLSKMPSNLQEEVQELPFENFCLLTYKIDYNYY